MIVANWKMHFTLNKALDVACSIKDNMNDVKINTVIAPPFLYLKPLADCFVGSQLKVASQNLFYEDEGAYTGEISALMIKSIGCEYAIIGHSERRLLFGETDEVIHKKVQSAIKNNLTPILCVGESLQERNANKTFIVIESQLVNDLRDVKETVIIAYEPIWAIGTGQSAAVDQIYEVHGFIKGMINTKVLYGGSVNPQNAYELSCLNDIDGFLIGGASLDPNKFREIIFDFQKAKGVS